MALVQRKKSKAVTKPYNHNPHIVCHYSMVHGESVVEVGSEIKFHGTRGKFKFIKHVVNSELEVEWIDCMDLKTGEFRSFYVNRLKHKPAKKRKRRKKWEIERDNMIADQPPLVVTVSNYGTCSKCKCTLDETSASPSIVKRKSGYCRKCMREYLKEKKK